MQAPAQQPSEKQSAGNRSAARPSPGVLIWAALAALAVGLFAAMSLLTLPGSTLRPAPMDATPTSTPTQRAAEDQPTPDQPTPDQPTPDQPTPDLSAAGADLTPMPTPSPTPTAPAPPLPATADGDPAALLGLWLSAVSAITALIGLASSLWLGWRKEGREMAQHRLELEKARLEIRKLEQELGPTRPDAASSP